MGMQHMLMIIVIVIHSGVVAVLSKMACQIRVHTYRVNTTRRMVVVFMLNAIFDMIFIDVDGTWHGFLYDFD